MPNYVGTTYPIIPIYEIIIVGIGVLFNFYVGVGLNLIRYLQNNYY